MIIIYILIKIVKSRLLLYFVRYSVYLKFSSFQIEYKLIQLSWPSISTVPIRRLAEAVLGKSVYFLFDEIQVVEGWQCVINRIRVSYNSDIIITGSNANMLSGELATFLSGRYIEIPIYPFSFREYLTVRGIEQDSRHVDSAYNQYEKHGGFLSVIIAEETIKDTILSGIFDTIVLNDVALRAGVKDATALKFIIRFLTDNVGQLINASKIFNTLKNEGLKISGHTVNRYLDLLENGYLYYRAKQYDIRGREYLSTNMKYFIVDDGLRRNAVGRKDGNYKKIVVTGRYHEVEQIEGIPIIYIVDWLIAE
ncbi:ATP-binding protein [Marinilactibacillus sp. GCM10026970]|uniref:ATP-binding protein n=1 Tax=Marinilactibacillus sp. GCM10026970 TaxID=3252642 RepID=UPI0036220982